MMTGNTPSDPPSDPSSASTEPSPAPSEPVEGASVAGTARRLSGQIGLGAVMVLCGVLLATTARISGGESIRSESRSEEHTSELQSRGHLVCRLLLEKKNTKIYSTA